MKQKNINRILVVLISTLGAIIVAFITQDIHVIVDLPQINNSSSTISTEPLSTSNSSDISSDNNSPGTSDNTPIDLILRADNKGGKWGYVDQFGNERIPHAYDWADEFFDEYAAVYNGSSWGFVSKDGIEKISFKYNGAWSFIDGLAPVFNGDKWGFIDKQGNIKIPYKFNNILRTYVVDKQVYIDENDHVIDYSVEMRGSTVSSQAVSNSSAPPVLNSNVPIIDFLKGSVSAVLDGSELTIVIDENAVKALNGENVYPFKWGFQLTGRLGTKSEGDYVIELELCIDSGGSVIDTNSAAYIATSSTAMDQVQNNLTKVVAHLENSRYVLSCNVANDYIRLEDICINTTYFY